MPGWFEVAASDAVKFSFVLKAANAEVILRSQVYTTKGAAMSGISSVQTNSAIADRYERLEASDGRSYFNLKAANAQVVGTSQMYSSPASRDAGIESVKTNGSTVSIKDLTA